MLTPYESATLITMVTSLNIKNRSETDEHCHLPTVLMILSTKYIYMKLNSYQKIILAVVSLPESQTWSI